MSPPGERVTSVIRRFVQQSRSRGTTRIPQPFEDHVGIQRVSPRYLGNRHIRGRRLKTDRQLLLVIPKPLRALDHPKLRSVRYPKRTLSHPLDPWQCSDAGRLLWNAIRLRSNRRACAVALWPRLGCPLPSGKRERRSTGGSLACKALAPRQQVAGRQHPSPRLRR